MAHVRILKHHLHSKFLLLGFVESILLAASVYLGVLARSLWGEFLQPGDSLLLKAVVFSFVMSCCTLSLGVYTSFFREGFTGMALRSVASYCLLGTAALTIIYYIFPELYLGRGALFLVVLIALVLVLLVRWFFYHIVDLSQLNRRIVIYGAGEKAKLILSEIHSERFLLGIEVVGCVPSGSEKVCVTDESLLPVPDSWASFVSERDISEIVVAPDERRRSLGSDFPIDELLDCKLSGVQITDAQAFCERDLLKIEVSLLRTGWMLFSDGFRYSVLRDISKRLFDIVIALILIAITWPLMLLTAAAIMLESGWPLIYRQIRVGLNGKPFAICKFRSMRQDAEKDGKAVWAQKNDSRVTRVGAVIRNARLDELPQLYNVLKGDMSFVGPRPERPEFVEQLSRSLPYYDARHRVKPGLMGWAQFKYPYGASEEDALNKLKYDLYYVKNHSVLIDVLIVIQTVEVVLLGKGVH